MKLHPHPSDDSTETKLRSVVMGTAGHIDHGKTALVYALTGTDTDRLPEEKRRGITIDLGFAALPLPDGRGGKLELSIVDVPGHHAFIRNMLAGAGGIDCVMLVIAANEGVKAQTEEHLAICHLLGIRRGFTVLTKLDTVTSERLHQVCEDVRDFLRNSFLESAPILAVSAMTGEGIAELKTALAAMLSGIPDRSSDYVPRLPLDRAFSLRGFGTVVTGTLQHGTLHVGDQLEQLPAGRLLRVRGVQTHGRNRREAHAPCRAALNVADLEVAQVHRGDVLVPPGTLKPVSTIDVELSWLPDAHPLKHRSKVRVHAFTSESIATLLFYEPDKRSDSEGILARLQLSKPLLVIPGDHFVLRRCSPAATVGGGVVLDTQVRRGLKKSAALRWLEQLRHADTAESLRLRISRRGNSGTSLKDLIAETGMTANALRLKTKALVAAGRLRSCGPNGTLIEHFVAAEALGEVENGIVRELGLASSGRATKAELRSRAQLSEQVFDLAIAELASAKKIEIAAQTVNLPGRGEEIPEATRLRLEAVEAIYSAAALAMPLLSEVAARLRLQPKEMHEAITLLLRAKRLVRMGADDVFIHPAALDRLYADLRKHRGERFDVARFKSFTGLTRKHAIPLLEHLDQAHVTRNSGGIRIVL